MLTDRVNTLSESITIAITTLAQELKAEGKDILSFSAGEPDFDTPQVIKDAAIAAINEGFTKYTAVDGIVELRVAIAAKLKKDNGLTYAPNQIITNNGAKHSLFNLISATIQKGAEVIIPSPYWVTYPELVNYCGGKVVEIETTDETSFKITPEQLKAAITPKSRMLILTSPSNPTGSIYTRDELVELGKVLEGTDIIVASDEMYEKLTYDGTFTSCAAVSEDMYKRTVTINGLSKSVAMTGWRFGYMAAADTELIKATKKLQSQSTSNINTITQKAAIAGLDGSADADIEMMRKAFIERRDEAVKLVNAIDGLSVVKPDGAFYLFVNIKEVSSDSLDFAKELLDKKLVAVVPGVAFGSEGYFRMSFATDIETIRTGIARIAEFVAELKN
ncbi:aspartate aminotransferase [Sulfurimonas gotlandica GD1]|jgi:aspartate aminotransferase|uniref:Aspartate aminotransferase n=1 Tax=Sulfurimonas gotlandica (strain DSM 19862 / JCM 16533 / GD1) TaxID=929558 RepID=B6BK59_SULGG|nr:pyridoxal phosphate-dependent aminotransferase [Sulfurimonas gotlandica]EDZ62768.1 aspartate aminotransferase [Sulfurimonas gotlandica GD1]EHP31151.1 aspartate aminotransferase [Sulfurimonas gotlandica GD1]